MSNIFNFLKIIGLERIILILTALALIILYSINTSLKADLERLELANTRLKMVNESNTQELQKLRAYYEKTLNEITETEKKKRITTLKINELKKSSSSVSSKNIISEFNSILNSLF